MTDYENRLILEKRALGLSFVQIGRELGRSEDAVRMAFNRITRKAPVKVVPRKISINTPGVVTCKCCGETFTRTAAGAKRVFCSKKCRYDWNNRKKRRASYILVCKHCGREFVTFGNPHRRFCSRRCFTDWQKGQSHA